MKNNIKLVIGLEFLILFIVLLLISGSNILNTLTYLIDFVSLIVIILVTIPPLIIMGEFGNFIKAFSVGKKKYTLLELKSINGAVAACQKLLLYGGIIVIIVELVIILSRIDDLSFIGPNLAVAILLMLYIAIFEYLLIPVKLNAEKTMNEEMDIDVEE